MDSKLKLPPVEGNPSGSEPEQQQKPSGAGRFLTERNGVPVWVDSSRSTGRTGPSEARKPNSPSKTPEQIASAIKRKLGI